MPDADANVTVTFNENFPSTFSNDVAKSENFDGAAQTLFEMTSSEGTMDLVADSAAKNNKTTGKIVNAKSPTNGEVALEAKTLGVEKAAYVQFDFRMEGGQGNKTTMFALRDSADKNIFSINALTNGNGIFGSVKINDDITLNNAIVTAEEGMGGLTAAKYSSTGWLTVSAAIDFDAKKSTVLITRLSDGSLVYFGDVPFADNDVAGFDKIHASAGKQYGAISFDDVTIKGGKATNVTATDPGAENGTLTYKKDGSKIVITPTPASGKKVKKVTVTDGGEPQEVTANESGAYEYTPTTDTVTLSAEFVRDDIATVTVTGDDMVQQGQSSTAAYVATFASAKGEAVTLEEDEQVKWSVTGASNESGTTITEGNLTLAADETGTAGKVTVVASVPKKNGEAEAITGSMEVNVSTQTLYNVTKAEITEGGDIEISPNRAAENTKVYVTAKPQTGYEVDDIKIKGTVTQEESIKSSFAEGKYSFDMKNEDITVTATFKKIKYDITNGSEEGDRTENGGYISKIEVSDVDATQAVMGDTVKVTLTPEAKYESAGVEVTGAEDIEVTPGETNVYTFTMPAAAVTVTAKFQKEALADRKPGDTYDQEIMAPIFDNTHVATGGNNNGAVKYDGSQKRVGDRLVTMASDKRRADIPWSNPNMKVDPCTVYVVFDFNVATGGGVIVQPAKDNGTKATGYTIKEASGKLTINDQATTLEPDKWYNAVITGVRNASGNLTTSSLAVYAINEEDDTVTTSSNLIQDVSSINGGTVSPWNCVHFLPIEGDTQSMFDNAYYCTDPFYEAKITVTGTDTGEAEGGNPTPVNDATVTVKKDGKEVAKQTSGAEGVYTFKLQAGTYSVEVAATDAYEAKTLETLTVTKAGANTATINPKKQDKTVNSVTVTDKLGDDHSDSEFLVLSSDKQKTIKLTAVAKNLAGAVIKDAEITWESDKSGEGVTVNEGTVTIDANTGAETPVIATITAKAGDEKTDTYKIKVDKTGTETLLDYCDDFDGETNVFSNGATGNTAAGKVLVGAADPGVKWELPEAMTLTDKEILTVSYVDYNGWTGSTQKTVQFLSDDTTPLAEYKYNDATGVGGTPCGIDMLKIGGTDKVTSASPFDAQSHNSSGKGANKLENFTATDNDNCLVEFSVSGAAEDNVQLKYTARGTVANDGQPFKGTVVSAKFKGVSLTTTKQDSAAIGKFRVTLTREAGE